MQTEQAPPTVSVAEIGDLREEPLQAKPLPEDVDVRVELGRSVIGQFGDAVDDKGVELGGGCKERGVWFWWGRINEAGLGHGEESEWRV